MSEDPQLPFFLEIATEAAYAGAAVLKRYWGVLANVRDKDLPGDLVTEADEASEAAILELLQRHVAGHSFLAEESGLQSGSTPYLWAIDPLDGTVNYAHQFPFFAVSIALLIAGQPAVGVVLDPMQNELYQATRGGGAFCNRQPIHVSQVRMLEHSLLGTGFPYDRSCTGDNNYAEFCHFSNISQGIRRPGAAALDLAYVACGRLEGFWERKLKPWDIAAGAVLITEAGGRISAYDGSPLRLDGDETLASNGFIHARMSQELLKVSAASQT